MINRFKREPELEGQISAFTPAVLKTTFTSEIHGAFIYASTVLPQST
jgi:hypothetical protein